MSLSRPEFARRAAIFIGLAALAVVVLMLVWLTAAIWLVVFAGVLLAIFLDGLARLVSRHTPLARKPALGLVVVTLLALAAATAWFLGPQIADQASALSTELPQTMQRVREWVRDLPGGQAIAAQIPSSPESVLTSGSAGFGQLRTVFSTIVGLFANGLIIAFVGIYLAVHPGRYIEALTYLAPKRHREHADFVLCSVVTALRYWLIGQISAMAIIGTLTAVGLMIFGIPLALALGLIAALLSFIPYIGPILALAPALMVALGEGGDAVFVVLAIYISVQFLESYLITPLVQDHAVSMPPAVLIMAQLMMGALAGAFGIAVAAPLAVVTVVFVQVLYVEDALGEDVHVLGEQEEEGKDGDAEAG